MIAKSISIIIVLFAVTAAQRNCSSSSVQTFSFGGCPSTCRPLTEEQFGRAFLQCKRRAAMGCIMKPCGPSDKRFSAFSCSTNARLLPKQTVCPGDTLVFDRVSINDRFRFMYMLNASGSMTSASTSSGIPSSGDIDFYLLSDVTGSMSDAIAAVRTQFISLVDTFSKTNPNVKFGLGIYRDETELGNDGFENVRTITSNLTSIRVAINKLRAMGGADGPEANLVALYRVATSEKIGWRDGARKIVAYFGDWPGHEPTCPGFGVPELNRTFVARKLEEKNITVVAVSFPPPGLDSNSISVFRCGDRKKAGPGQASVITKRTGGALVQAGDQKRVLFSIQRALRGISTEEQVNVDESECVTGIKSRHVPSLPATVAMGGELEVRNIIKLKKRVCAIDRMGLRKFECKYRYGNGQSVTVRFTRIRDCPARKN